MSNVSSATNYFPTVNEGFITTVAAPGISSGGSTVPLTSVSGLTNGTTFVGIVEPGLTNQQAFTGIVDTAGAQITGVVWTRGSNTAHATGKTIVDYVTGTAINLITTGIRKEHNSNGTHAAVTATSLAVSGGATVGGTLASTGAISENGVARASGYLAGSGTWTYASATTFTVPAADAANMSAGTKLKLTQTTAKYFYVASVSGTTVTIAVNTDYTLANAAITSPMYSNQSSPAGFPSYLNYTPTLANITIGNGTIAAYYKMSGGTVSVKFLITLGSTSVVGTGPTVSFPVTSATTVYSSPDTPLGIATYVDASTQAYAGYVGYFSTTTGNLLYYRQDSASIKIGPLSAVNPFTWGTSDFITGEIEYRAA